MPIAMLLSFWFNLYGTRWFGNSVEQCFLQWRKTIFNYWYKHQAYASAADPSMIEHSLTIPLFASYISAYYGASEKFISRRNWINLCNINRINKIRISSVLEFYFCALCESSGQPTCTVLVDSVYRHGVVLVKDFRKLQRGKGQANRAVFLGSQSNRTTG